jgi:hypothetical protein
MTSKSRSIHRNACVRFVLGDGSVKSSVKKENRWYVDYTFTSNLIKMGIDTSNKS